MSGMIITVSSTACGTTPRLMFQKLLSPAHLPALYTYVIMLTRKRRKKCDVMNSKNKLRSAHPTIIPKKKKALTYRAKYKLCKAAAPTSIRYGASIFLRKRSQFIHISPDIASTHTPTPKSHNSRISTNARQIKRAFFFLVCSRKVCLYELERLCFRDNVGKYIVYTKNTFHIPAIFLLYNFWLV